MECITRRDCSESCRVAMAHIFRLARTSVMDMVEVEWKPMPVHTRFRTIRELRFQRISNIEDFGCGVRMVIHMLQHFVAEFVLFCFVSFVVWTFEPANRITNEIQ